MLSMIRQAAATLARKIRRTTDVDRWKRYSGLELNWDQRTEMIAAMIPEGSVVLELGSGKQRLKNFLPSTCTYIASDVIVHSDNTLIIDLNTHTLPEFSLHHVAVFSGVLEYIHDVPRVIEYLSNASTTTVLASYAPLYQDTLKARSWRLA